jgi:cell division transport system permease protein
MTKSKLIETTKKNMKRNRFLSLSTILVSTIVLLISSFFISISIISQKAVKYYEKKAEVIIFFKKDTKEDDILALKEKLDNPEIIEDIEYVDQQKALAIYQDYYSESPDLIATVTADSLPPSLEIRAKSIENLLTLIEVIEKEKETNSTIDDIFYFPDVVKTLESLSNIIKIVSIILISALVVIAFSLIRITIGFNINSHKEEIKIMNVVGSPDKYIKIPYILEGLYYGALGSVLAATLIIVPFYTIISSLMTNPDFSFSLNQVLKDLDLMFLKPVDPLFLITYYLVHLLVGALIGTISSLSAVRRYLD